MGGWDILEGSCVACGCRVVAWWGALCEVDTLAVEPHQSPCCEVVIALSEALELVGAVLRELVGSPCREALFLLRGDILLGAALQVRALRWEHVGESMLRGDTVEIRYTCRELCSK